MFGRPELIFKVKLKRYNGAKDDFLEIPLIFFSAFERVRLDPDDEMHKLGDIIQLYEPGPLPALEPIMHVGFLSHVLLYAECRWFRATWKEVTIQRFLDVLQGHRELGMVGLTEIKALEMGAGCTK